jgi:hypothetical protein
MSVLKNFKQSAGKGAMVGLVVGSAVGVVAGAYVIRQQQKTLNMHNQAIMMNTSAILALTTHVAKQQKSNNQ